MLLLGFAAAVVVGLSVTAFLVVTQPTVPVSPPPEVTAARIDPARLERRVRHLVSAYPHSQGTPEGMAQVADWITAELRPTTAEVAPQRFEVDGQEFRNVCAAFGPAGTERIVVGAHYDTAYGNPGADDNASGVAGLLGLAELLASARLEHRVELVAFALEEPPAFLTSSMGSAVHARALRDGGVAVRAMLSLEMIGYFDDEPRSQGYPSTALRPFYSSRANFIAVVSRLADRSLVRTVKAAMQGAASLPVASLNGPAIIPGVSFSDHLNYWAEGFPAAMITDTAFYRNPNYHGEGDLPETLDYRRMAEVVRGVFAAVLALDRQR
jgi:hypothetical protein